MQRKRNNLEKVLKRYTQGFYTQSDVKQVFDLLKSDGQTSLLEDEMDKVWDEYTDEEQTTEQYLRYKAEARTLLKRIRQPKQRFVIAHLLKYAAIFLFLTLLGTGFYYVVTHRAFSPDIVYTEICVNHGEHEQITLPDGTSVILNAGSSVRYPMQFTTEERLIELNGEAFFDVKKDEELPFIVRTESADIKVLGTSFNVKAYQADEQLTVSVQTGKVQVDMPESMTRLTVNEQLILDKQSGDFQKKKENVRRVKSWIYGGLYFNRTPIRSVVAELMRTYNCHILFDSRFVYDEYIYGEHDNKNLESVLKSIQYSTDIKYRKDGNTYILYKHK